MTNTIQSVHGSDGGWPLNKVLAAISSLGDLINPIATTNGDAQAIKTRCPIHGRPEGGHDSIRIAELPDGAVKVWCFAHCRYKDVVEAWGLTYRDLHTGPDGRQLEGANWLDPYRGTDDANADLLVDWFGNELLYGRGIGWMTWDGKRWTENDTAALGICRQASARLYHMANEATDPDRSKKFAGLAMRLGDTPPVKRAMEFAATELVVEGHQLDAHPDLLNTPDGVVNLRTGETTPHDRSLRMTKITRGSYRPGYKHPDWEQALQALPAGVADWFQVRIGQALTGHADPHGVLLILQGSGENGKTAICGDGIIPAFGDYATVASPKLLLSAKDEHSTEKTELRGRRLVVAEEMTEGRALNVTSLKQIQDVSSITARRLYRNNVSFDTSHTLFATTNYTPIVNETDHGTWRRLALLRFPYTFRKPGEDLLTEMCRRGDPELKPRLKAGQQGQHDAIITWAVEGAIRWYTDGALLNLPKRVAQDTEAWRAQADRILGFWREHLVVDRDAAVIKGDLLDAFNFWVRQSGHNAWSKELFHERFKQHHETVRYGVEESQPRDLDGLVISRPPDALRAELSDLPDIPARPRVYRGTRFSIDNDGADDEPEREPDTPSDQGGTSGTTDQKLFENQLREKSSEKPVPLVPPQVSGLSDLDEVRSSAVIGLDLETTGLDPHTSNIRLCQIATDSGHVFLFDCQQISIETIAEAFIDQAEIVGHNLKFDLRFLLAAGIELPRNIGSRLFDTMLASQLLSAGDRTVKHNLAVVAERYAGVELDKTEQTSDWSGELTDEQLRYAANDVAHLLAIREAQERELNEAGMGGVASMIEHRALPTIAWMEHSGMPFDSEAHQKLMVEVEAERKDVETKLIEAAGVETSQDEAAPKLIDIAISGRDINWSSWQQVKALLAERGHDVSDTSEATLLSLDDEVATLLVDYRHARKRQGIYGGPFANCVNPVTGRIHAEFLQLGSRAGRMSCTNPNLQQVPKFGGFRAMFRAPEGRVLLRTDYSQIELRVAAQLAPDEAMLEALRSGDDLHEATARRVLGKDEVTADDRKIAKSLNFGLVYGMGAQKLKRYAQANYGIEMNLAKAELYRDRFFATYKGLRRWHRSQPEGSVKTRTVTGRRRLGVDKFTFKVNTPVQGTAADGLKLALALLFERPGPASAFPVNVVHDEIVVECGIEDVDATREWVEDAMRDGMAEVLTAVPVEVETNHNERWGE